MKTLIEILFLSMVCVSCNKDQTEKNDFPNPVVAVHYEDSGGNDLFSDGRNGYTKDNVRTYTLINGKKSIDSDVDVFQNNKTAYNPYKWGTIYNEETKDSVFVAVFGLPANKIDYQIQHYFTTLIILKEGVQDTMRTYINGTKSIDSLWYNNLLLYVNPYPHESYPMNKIITIEKDK